VTAFRPTKNGGVFIQRIFGDEDAAVVAAVDRALGAATWKTTEHTFDVGKGKLALFDSAYAYEDADEDEILAVKLAPATYEIATSRVKEKDIELGLVRLTRK
jgi:hypothetical protein